MQYVTPDLCDAYPDVEVVEPMFANFGGRDSFAVRSSRLSVMKITQWLRRKSHNRVTVK